MKVILVIVATLLLCANAQGQLRKCTGLDGKVTYSDVLCDSSAVTGSIKNPNGNTLDASRSRQAVERAQASERKAQENAISNAARSQPTICEFSHYAVGDEKGKKLAENAKQECQRNNEAKKIGGEVSLEHYNLWKDHRQEMVTKRSSIGKGMNCVPNGFGGMRCN